MKATRYWKYFPVQCAADSEKTTRADEKRTNPIGAHLASLINHSGRVAKKRNPDAEARADARVEHYRQYDGQTFVLQHPTRKIYLTWLNAERGGLWTDRKDEAAHIKQDERNMVATLIEATFVTRGIELVAVPVANEKGELPA